jgi:hypothetical protein
MSHPSGVRTKLMTYCDDTMFTTEDLTSMQGLFERTHTCCQWVGVNINHNKSEIVGYDFKSQKVIDTASLKLGTNNLRQLTPSKPVIFFGHPRHHQTGYGSRPGSNSPPRKHNGTMCPLDSSTRSSDRHSEKRGSSHVDARILLSGRAKIMGQYRTQTQKQSSSKKKPVCFISAHH